MRKGTLQSCAVVAGACCGSSALAGFVGLEVDGGWINGKFVCRVHAKFDGDNFVVLSCFGLQSFAASDWNDSDFASGSWDPKLSIDSLTDSYVTIGGVPGFANTTSADPSWGLTGFNQPGIPNGAGWFNSNPPNLQGKVGANFRTLIGQFVYSSEPTQAYTSPLTVSFNQGLGTPTQFSVGATLSLHIPAPAALGVLSAVVIRLRGRRRDR